MTQICDTCGENKPCMKVDTSMGLRGLPKEWHGVMYEWICKECQEAEEIIKRYSDIKEAEEKKQKQLNWIKERDKILKKYGKK
jgi:hypothetical protein